MSWPNLTNLFSGADEEGEDIDSSCLTATPAPMRLKSCLVEAASGAEETSCNRQPDADDDSDVTFVGEGQATVPPRRSYFELLLSKQRESRRTSARRQEALMVAEKAWKETESSLYWRQRLYVYFQVEKYRPAGLTRVIGHDQILSMIYRLLEKGELPHLLFYGPPGTGKTTIVKAIARVLHGKRVPQMVLELNASDDRGIATIRTTVKTFAESSPPQLLTVVRQDVAVPVDPALTARKEEETEAMADEESHNVSEEASDPDAACKAGKSNPAEKPEPDCDAVLAPSPRVTSKQGLLTAFSGFHVKKSAAAASAVTVPPFSASAEKALVEAPRKETPAFLKAADKDMKDLPTTKIVPRIVSVETTEATESPDKDVHVHEKLKRLKLIILDEVDQMTSAAQQALRRVMESYAKNARFLLICNEIGKISPPLQSRCTALRVAPLPENHVRDKVREVVHAEGLHLSDDGFEELIFRSKGDLRSALNTLQAMNLMAQTTSLLRAPVPDVASMENSEPSNSDSKSQEKTQQVLSANEPIADKGQSKKASLTNSDVLKCLGLPERSQVETLFESLILGDLAKNINTIEDAVATKSINLFDLLNEIYNLTLRYKLPQEAMVKLLPRLDFIAQSLALGASDRLQMACFAAAFAEASLILRRQGIATIRDISASA